MSQPRQNLEQIYFEICEGYSNLRGCQLRHLSFIEQAGLQRRYTEALEWALSHGIQTESQILKKCQQDGTWSAAKALHIKSLQEKIAGMEKSKTKIKTISQIDGIYESLQGLRAELKKYTEEKYSFLSNCAELCADSKLRFYTLSLCIEKNGSRLYTEDELDELSDKEYANLEELYFQKIQELSIENIKRICIENFFCAPFGLIEKPIEFFGKPASSLSVFQVNMLRLGQTFAKVANETPDLPEDYDKCPERMLMFWYFLQNGGKNIEEDRQNTAQKFLGLAKSLPKR